MDCRKQIRTVFSFLFMFLVCVVPWEAESHAAEKAEAKIFLFDSLTTPGQAVKLQAQVWHEGLLGRVGLGGEPLEFLVQGKVVGTTMTGGDGRAFLEFTPRMRGNFVVTARLTGSPRVSDAEGTSVLASWERRKPILLVDLAAVMQRKVTPKSPLPSLPVTLGMTELGDPDANASQELEKLGKFYYNLMYLFRSDGGDVEQMQSWLRTHHFPQGFSQVIKSSRQALQQFITQLKEAGWENVSAGIGRTVEFAEVLVEHRLQTVIVGEVDKDEDLPRRAKLVKSWKKVRTHL